MKILKLGQKVVDRVTGCEGTIISLHMDQGKQKHYLYQPRGLNKKTGKPLKTEFVTADQLTAPGGVKPIKVKLPDHVPLRVLGTEVEDIASGYRGTATSLVLHINGCVHFNVQSKQTTPESGELVDSVNLDVRRLKGAAVPVITEEQEEASNAERPSPASDDTFSPNFGD